MNLTKFIAPFLLLTLFFFSACGNEGEVQQKVNEGDTEKKPLETKTPAVEAIRVADIQKAIIGRWEVTEAYRGKSKTESIDAAFYEFGEDGMVDSNLPGPDTATNQYTIEGKKLTTDGANATIYNIVDMDETNLAVVFNMRNTNFKLILKKAE